MSTPLGTPRFRNYGDWLIRRSTGTVGDFRMQVCIGIITNEGTRDHWLHRLTTDDINRILARYKEHVNYWNIAIAAIHRELQAFANALGSGHTFTEIATLFDSLPPKRIPTQVVFSYGQVKKEVLSPFDPGSSSGTWIPSPFTQDEISRIESWLVTYDSASSVRLVTQNLCEMRGSFTRNDILSLLQPMQETRSASQGQHFRYEIIQLH